MPSGAVAAELTDPAALRFSSIEDVVASVQGHDDWGTEFTERYLTYAQRPG